MSQELGQIAHQKIKHAFVNKNRLFMSQTNCFVKETRNYKQKFHWCGLA
jgi:hypothetical protein